jgi:hypothetical protein
MIKLKFAILSVILLQPVAVMALSGNVSTDTGRAIQKAEVIVTVAEKTYKSLTGSDGKFEIDNLPANSEYHLSLRKSGHGILNHSGNTSSNTALKLVLNPKKYQIKFKLINRSGEPLPNFPIKAGTLGSFYTNNLGEYTLNLDYGTKYNLSVPSELSAESEDYYFINKPSGVVTGNATRVLVGILN